MAKHGRLVKSQPEIELTTHLLREKFNYGTCSRILAIAGGDPGAQIAQLCVQHGHLRLGAAAEQNGGDARRLTSRTNHAA
jgi:hypothetical protein